MQPISGVIQHHVVGHRHDVGTPLVRRRHQHDWTWLNLAVCLR